MLLHRQTPGYLWPCIYCRSRYIFFRRLVFLCIASECCNCSYPKDCSIKHGMELKLEKEYYFTSPSCYSSQYNNHLHARIQMRCTVKWYRGKMRISSWVWMVGQCGWHLTRCLVSVKPLQSSGFYPWQRSAGNYSNLPIKNIITQSASVPQVTENACTCRQGRLLSDTRAHTTVILWYQ